MLLTQWKNTKFVITEHQVEMYEGIFYESKRTFELTKIVNIQTSQKLLARL